MIVGIGIDIIELGRVRSLLERSKKFPDRILTPREKRQFDQLPPTRQAEFLAGRFAAKEAYAKALGTGIGGHLSFQDIEIVSDASGKPSVVVRCGSEGDIVHLSISHSRDYAVAQVIIERLGPLTPTDACHS
ncbi:holo-ACP synthase [Geobacillus vulcani]|uniref:holo-ACP synthase n=1 Tax=Geobacillus vulcani TaxID=135517 RepID=UPI0004DF09E9|nr:holo-ACP synthase [Geobacillus vulcani]